MNCIIGIYGIKFILQVNTDLCNDREEKLRWRGKSHGISSWIRYDDYLSAKSKKNGTDFYSHKLGRVVYRVMKLIREWVRICSGREENYGVARVTMIKVYQRDTERIDATFSTRAIISFSPFTVTNDRPEMRPELDNSERKLRVFSSVLFLLLLLLFLFLHTFLSVPSQKRFLKIFSMY